MATVSQSNPNRRRLQQAFEHASKTLAQGQFEYAANTLTQCVLGDPGNQLYARAFLDCLFKLYNNNKKGSRMASISGMGAKASAKKAAMSKDWPNVLKNGVEFLKLNPWDIGTLTAMAQACDSLEHASSQLVYLKAALDVNLKDVEVNRLCGRALARVGQFDQAIACWHRVEQAKPGDPEATRTVADLAIEKTISKGRYDEAQSSRDVKVVNSSEPQEGETVMTPEQRLERQIAKNPAELSNYVELADLHIRNDRLKEAEQVFAKALEASGGEVSILERYEDTQLRRGRQQLAIAEKLATERGTEEDVDRAQTMKSELNRLELDVYGKRTERYPTNLNFKYELGIRLKNAGNYAEAIKQLQQARGDSKRKALVHVELGDCFVQIKQLKMALNNFEEAINTLSDHNNDTGKTALYSAGRIAYKLNNRELAEKYLTELAGIDFGYRDVAKWLDKLASDGQTE